MNQQDLDMNRIFVLMAKIEKNINGLFHVYYPELEKAIWNARDNNKPLNFYIEQLNKILDQQGE